MLFIFQFSVTVQEMRKCYHCHSNETKWNSYFYSKESFIFSKYGIYEIKVSNIPEHIKNISLAFLNKDEINRIVQKDDDRPHSKDYLIFLHSGNGKVFRKVDDNSKRWFVFFPKNYKYHGNINVICYKNEFVYQIDNHNFYLFLFFISVFAYFLILKIQKYDKRKIFNIRNQILAFAIFLFHFISSFKIPINEYYLFLIHWFIEIIFILIVFISLFESLFVLQSIAIYLISLLFEEMPCVFMILTIFIFIPITLCIQKKKYIFYFENNKFVAKKKQIYLFGRFYTVLWICSCLFSFKGIFSIIPDFIFILILHKLFKEKNWTKIKNFLSSPYENSNDFVTFSNYNQYNIVEKCYFNHYISDDSCSSTDVESSSSCDMSDWSSSSF